MEVIKHTHTHTHTHTANLQIGVGCVLSCMVLGVYSAWEGLIVASRRSSREASGGKELPCQRRAAQRSPQQQQQESRLQDATVTFSSLFIDYWYFTYIIRLFVVVVRHFRCVYRNLNYMQCREHLKKGSFQTSCLPCFPMDAFTLGHCSVSTRQLQGH